MLDSLNTSEKRQQFALILYFQQIVEDLVENKLKSTFQMKNSDPMTIKSDSFLSGTNMTESEKQEMKFILDYVEEKFSELKNCLVSQIEEKIKPVFIHEIVSKLLKLIESEKRQQI